MIVNIPTSKDYEIIGKDCIIQALTLIYDTFEDKDSNDLINFYQRTLRNTIILIYQGVEILMKAEICKKTPLLIIDNKRKGWPSLPDSSNKDFNDFYTISGDDLLRTFFSVQEIWKDQSIKQNFIEFYNNLRKKRNIIMHGVIGIDLKPNNKIILCIEALSFFFGKTMWIQELKQDIKNNPELQGLEKNSDLFFLYKLLKIIENSMTLTELNKYLGIKLKKDRSKCCHCSNAIQVFSNNLIADWTFIKDNKINCLICNKKTIKPKSR
ncbi:MAG: hypothetical protein Kow0068_08680 [Marinilabiliales bacterium]